jgi:Tol biopolymer transport system component
VVAHPYHAGPVEHPPFAFRRGDKIMVRYPGGVENVVFDDEGRTLNCPLAWSPDGRTLYHAHDNQIQALDIEAGHKVAEWSIGPTVWFLDCCEATGRLACNVQSTPTASLVLLDPSTGSTNSLYTSEYFSIKGSWRAGRVVIWQNGMLREVLLSSGAARDLFRGPGDFDLSPDGLRLALADTGLTITTLSGRVCEYVADAGGHPSWSPNGTQVAFMNDENEFWLGSERIAWMPGDAVGLLERRGSYASAPIWSTDGRFLFVQLTLSERNPNPPPPPSFEELQEKLTQMDMPGVTLEALKMGYFHSTFEYQFCSVVLDLERCLYEVWEGYRTNGSWRP